jgi:LPXTG-motif cell wall-anchored protein
VLTVAANTVNPAGFIFTGWSDGTNLYQAGEQIVVGASDITLSAVWNPVYLRVSYLIGKGAKGTLPEDASFAYGSNVPLSNGLALKVSGKRFAGWSDGVKTYKPGASIPSLTQDTNLTAVWKSENLASTGTDGNALALTAGFGILLLLLGSLLQISKRHKRR